MHANEINTDASLVRSLLAGQFPGWAGFGISPVASAGTDNALYRLGDDMVVRLPRIREAAGQVEKEHRWLPVFATSLPLTIPAPLAKGEPGDGYPFRWSVYRWLDGRDARTGDVRDMYQVARDVARFVRALQSLDATDGPAPEDNSRGEPLAERDEETREAIASLASLGDVLDTGAATAAWEADLQAPVWGSSPVWVHGDLQPGNLLVHRGRVVSVIDFGCLSVGDPACDLQFAWNYLSGETREMYREELAADDAMWARGRGWALSVALIALPY